LSKSLSVRCKINPQRADRAICRLARRPRTVADRASLLRISSSYLRDQTCWIGAAPFSLTRPPRRVFAVHERVSHLFRTLSFYPINWHAASRRSILQTRLYPRALSFFPFDYRTTSLRSDPRALSFHDRLADNFVTFDSTRAFIHARVDAGRHGVGASCRVAS